MFDLDAGKMILFGAVALVVIGPRELPAALRSAGRVVASLRRVQTDLRKTVNEFMADTSVERELADAGETLRVNLALNPATAMRGELPGTAPAAAALAQQQAMDYATPEMRAYLAPAAEERPLS